MAVTHTFVSAKSDGGDATVVRPSNWNADHTIDGITRFGTGVGVDATTVEYTQYGLFFGNDVAARRAVFIGGYSPGWGVTVGADCYFGFSATVMGNTSDIRAADTTIYRDAANTVAQRNDTNAQSFRVYNTYSDASNYERGVFDWTTVGNYLTIGTQAAGTGSARHVIIDSTGHTYLRANSSSSILIGHSSANVIYINAGQTRFGLDRDFLLNWSGTASDPTQAADIGLKRAAAGVLEVNNGTAGTLRDIKARDITLTASSSLTPANNGELVIQATSNTSLTFKYKGSDGTVRSASLTLT